MASEPTSSHFAQVLRVLEGERVPIEGGSSKVLRFMLERAEGCDVLLQSDRFEIRYGWYPARHRYHPPTGIAVLSYLLESTTAVAGVGEFQGVLGPAAVPALDWLPWSYERRRVWIRRSESSVMIMIRSAETVSEAIAPVPEPIEYPPPAFAEMSEPIPCQTCGTTSSRFRQLGGGYVVCGSCGCSFIVTNGVVVQPAIAADGASPRR